MVIDFERTRLDVFGQGVTVTSWYEADKKRFRANAPAFLHLMGGHDTQDPPNVGATREHAIRSVRDRLEAYFKLQDTRRRG